MKVHKVIRAIIARLARVRKVIVDVGKLRELNQPRGIRRGRKLWIKI